MPRFIDDIKTSCDRDARRHEHVGRVAVFFGWVAVRRDPARRTAADVEDLDGFSVCEPDQAMLSCRSVVVLAHQPSRQAHRDGMRGVAMSSLEESGEPEHGNGEVKVPAAELATVDCVGTPMLPSDAMSYPSQAPTRVVL